MIFKFFMVCSVALLTSCKESNTDCQYVRIYDCAAGTVAFQLAGDKGTKQNIHPDKCESTDMLSTQPDQGFLIHATAKINERLKSKTVLQNCNWSEIADQKTECTFEPVDDTSYKIELDFTAATAVITRTVAGETKSFLNENCLYYDTGMVVN